MDYRTKQARTADEIAERWREGQRERDRVATLVADRDKRAAKACARHARLRWADGESYQRLMKASTDLMSKIMSGSGTGTGEIRELLEIYTSLPDRLCAEKFPPIIVPELPGWPEEADDANVIERREAELDGVLAELARVEERLRDDERAIQALEEATRDERRALTAKGLIFRIDQCEVWLETLQRTLEATSPVGQSLSKHSSAPEPVSMRAPMVWLAFGFLALVQVGVLVAVDKVPLLRGVAWLVGLFATTVGLLAWRRRRHLPELRGNESRRGRGARFGIGLFVKIYLAVVAVAVVVLGARGYAQPTWFVVLGLVTSFFPLAIAAWLVWRERKSTLLLRRLAGSAGAITGELVEGSAKRAREFSLVTTYLQFRNEQGQQQTSRRWEWSDTASTTGQATIELEDGTRAKLDLAKAHWASTRVGVRNGSVEEALEPSDRVLIRGRVNREDGGITSDDDGAVIVLGTEDRDPVAAIGSRRLSHWAGVTSLAILAAGGAAISWWNPFQTHVTYRGRVSTSEMPGIAPGARCSVDFRHLAGESGMHTCQLAVECDGRVLYGGAGLGFVSCLFDAQGSPSADDLIPGDGDEAVIFDAADREVTTWDTLDRNVRIELEN